jgi:hypothetical protein
MSRDIVWLAERGRAGTFPETFCAMSTTKNVIDPQLPNDTGSLQYILDDEYARAYLLLLRLWHTNSHFLSADNHIISTTRLENKSSKQLLNDAEEHAEKRRPLDLMVAEERVEMLLKATEQLRLSDLEAAEQHVEKNHLSDLQAAEDHFQVLEEHAERGLQSTLGIVYS